MKEVKKEILAQQAAGKSNREIAEYFCSKEMVQREAGIMPRRRGRPPKGYVPAEEEKENEIRRLKMENELLRDFLWLAARREMHG